MRRAIADIEVELQERLAYFEKEGKHSKLSACACVPATTGDDGGGGSCAGRNYSRQSTGARPGRRQHLLDFFPKDYCWSLTSHTYRTTATRPYHGDRSARRPHRARFRLPSAPTTASGYEELLERVNQCVFMSATLRLRDIVPTSGRADRPPTGLIDPKSSSGRPRARSTTS